MAELGRGRAERYHEAVGRAGAPTSGSTRSIAIGPLSRATAARWYPTLDDALDGRCRRDPPGRCRAREGQPLDGARGRRGGGGGVKQVLAAGVAAMLLGILAGPAFIAFLRRNEFGQQIREEGPAGHMSKQGTPTLGGLVLLACTLISFLVFTKRTTPGLAVAGTMLACAAIGFVDDYLKLTNRQVARPLRPLEDARCSLPWSRAWPSSPTASTSRPTSICRSSTPTSRSGPAYYVFIFLVVAGAANAVNLTDGLDGLAAGTMTIAALTYSAMGVVAFLAARGLYPQNDPALARPRDHGRRARRGLRGVPLVQRLPGRRLHGRHRGVRAGRRARGAGGVHQDRGAARRHRRRLRDRGAVGRDPGDRVPIDRQAGAS